MRKMSSLRSGFGMIEALIVAVILGIVAVGTSKMLTTSFRTTRQLAQSNELTTLKFNIANLLSNTLSCKKTFESITLASTTPEQLSLRDTVGREVIKQGQVYGGMYVQSLTYEPKVSYPTAYLIAIRLTAKRVPSFGGQQYYTSDFMVSLAIDPTPPKSITDCLYAPNGTWTLVNSSKVTVPTDPSDPKWLMTGLLTTGMTLSKLPPNTHYSAAYEKFTFAPPSSTTAKCVLPGICEGHSECLARGKTGYIDCPYVESPMSNTVEARGNMWQLNAAAKIGTVGEHSIATVKILVRDVDTASDVATLDVGDCATLRQCSSTSPVYMVPITIGHKYAFRFRLQLSTTTNFPLPLDTDKYPLAEVQNPTVYYQEYLKF